MPLCLVARAGPGRAERHFLCKMEVTNCAAPVKMDKDDISKKLDQADEDTAGLSSKRRGVEEELDSIDRVLDALKMRQLKRQKVVMDDQTKQQRAMDKEKEERTKFNTQKDK